MAAAATRCAVELRWRVLKESLSTHRHIVPAWEAVFYAAPLVCGRCVVGIDSIATGHWIIEFRRLTFCLSAQEFGR
jgi:hypothetical protein